MKSLGWKTRDFNCLLEIKPLAEDIFREQYWFKKLEHLNFREEEFCSMDYDEIKTVTVSLLGESFTLRCHKSQADSLQRAVGKIQEITAKILRDNPSLTPQQASIIAAIESQSQLQRYLDTSTPFQEQAMQLIHRIKRNLNNIDS